MRRSIACLLLALVPVLASAAGAAATPPVPGPAAVPTCAAVPRALYGLSLEAMGGYPGSLKAGLVREGTAQVVTGVGFESIQGQSEGVRYPRIMAFFDFRRSDREHIQKNRGFSGS